MIKEIQRPNIEFNFSTFKDKYYYDDEKKEYFCKNEYLIRYFNLDGNIHRENDCAVYWLEILNNISYQEYWKNNFPHRDDGPYRLPRGHIYNFSINGLYCNSIFFQEKTNHLICKYCADFCNQNCFI